MLSEKIQKILLEVQKPGRYVGGELNSVIKNKDDVAVRYAFCFPDTYEIGMSHLGMKILYSVVNGATMSFIFLLYEMTSIATVFFITAGTFGAMAVVGYTTKKDLTSMGRILFMGLIGLVIASLVNIFLKSSGMTLVLSYVGVIIFVGLTAWDSQKIKHMLMQAPDVSEGTQKLALLGALTLYLDFINLFIYLLRIFGKRR